MDVYLVRHAIVATRLRPVPIFLPIRAIHPAVGGAGLESALALAQRSVVEIMVHPALEDERALVLSDGWQRDIADLQVGTFADFAP